MKQHYTLAEVHQYRLDLEAEEAKVRRAAPDSHAGHLARATVQSMREVYLRMNESIEREGARRPSFFARLLDRIMFPPRSSSEKDYLHQIYLGSPGDIVPPIVNRKSKEG